MKLNKFNRDQIITAAILALNTKRDPQGQRNQVAVSMFQEWHRAWMPSFVRQLWDDVAGFGFLDTREDNVDFGPLSDSWRSDSPEVTYCRSFDEAFNPIIEILSNGKGKRIRQKTWDNAKCPDNVRDYLLQWYAQEAKFDQACKEVRTAVASATTVKSLVEKYPDLSPYVPQEAGRQMALATNLDTFRALVHP